MLMSAQDCSVLIVDVQSRLAPAIHEGARIVAHCVWLTRLAERVGVPVVITEHCAEKIGPTVDTLRAAVAVAQVVGKEAFSAHADGCLASTAVDRRRQVVVCGTEAHVCVLQTALDLRWAGKEVFVVADAVSSRAPADRDLALARMRQRGIEIVSREMVAFEWLQRGGTAQFSAINREFIR